MTKNNVIPKNIIIQNNNMQKRDFFFPEEETAGENINVSDNDGKKV